MFIAETWALWLLAALALGALELATGTFVLIALGCASLAGALVAVWVPAALETQLLAFAIAASVLLPAAIALYRYRRRHSRPRFGVTGERGSADTPVDVIDQGGRIGVVYKGDFFPARCVGGGMPETGDRVRVTGFQGITAIVEPQLSN